MNNKNHKFKLRNISLNALAKEKIMLKSENREQKIICFWLPTYPEILESFIRSLIAKNTYSIRIFCLGDILPERIKSYEKDSLQELCDIQYFDSTASVKEYFTKNMQGNEDAIHIFGGFLGKVGECLNLYQDIYGGKKAFVFTEKPSFLPYKSKVKTCLFTRLKRVRSHFLYKRAYKQKATAIAGVIVTGQKGVKQLKRYGIPENKLFNFMYSHIDGKMEHFEPADDGKIKFVYVGRFNYCNRGLDDLIYAIDKLSANSWSLDLVGGYGEEAEEIIKWANEKQNVNYIGFWKSDEVINNLQKYDVCISPTRVDGWRIQVNQAIIAGIGTITTNEAVSDELIDYSQAGAVVKASKKKELLKVLEEIIANPEIVDTWKENAKKYSPKISNENLADYFLDIIEYSTGKKKEKPVCPWKVEN